MDGWIQRPDGWNHVNSLEDYDSDDSVCLSSVDNYLDIEYVFVLAGGLDQEGRNHPWVKDRLDMALELYRARRRKICILGGGTYHKPPHLNSEGFAMHEATIGAKYLIQHGVLPCDLYREWGSYDTIANGFFSLLNFVLPLELTNVLIVTSDFHIPRSKAIFNWIYGLFAPDCHLDFLWVSTKHLDSEIIGVRSEKEAQSLISLKKVIDRVDSKNKFHEWFYQEHQAYNCLFDVEKEKISSVLAKSY